MAKYTDLDEALANPQDVEDGRIHHTGATTPGQNLSQQAFLPVGLKVKFDPVIFPCYHLAESLQDEGIISVTGGGHKEQ